jgi:uncharacterized membrane protein
MRKRHLFYFLSVVSALLLALSSGMESLLTTRLDANPWMCSISAYFIGMILTFLILLVLSIPVKRKKVGSLLDPSFDGLRLITAPEIKYHIFAGIGNVAQGYAYYWILSKFLDPSSVLPFTQIVILYLLAIEAIGEKNAPTLAEIQCVTIVTFGALLSSFSRGGIDYFALVLVFLVINPGFAILSIYQRKLKNLKINRKPNDSLNIRFWNLVFCSIFILIAVMVKDPTLIGKTFGAVTENLDVVIPTLIFLFLSYVLFIRALGIGTASVTQAIRSSSLLFSIPISIVLGRFFFTPGLLLIKVMGIVLVVLGIVSFALTDVKAWICIKVLPGYSIEKMLGKIWSIKGVESVAAIAGSIDIIAKARTRTLGKGYERIIRKLEEIEGIRKIKWQSILKEWEEI